MYDHTKQYKHDIIRARAISDVDDLLPKYAMTIDQICPCTKEDFVKHFDLAFEEYALKKARDPNNLSARKKTLDNHRTEITGSLFGMYYEEDGMIYSSERTRKFLQDNDQPAFFKDWLIKMQFPNGSQTPKKYRAHIEKGIKCHPYSLLLKVLEYAKREGIALLKQEIGYYILNSEDVLMGNTTANEVFDAIILDKKNISEPRKIIIPEGESTAYDQHIGDQLQYLQLANLIIFDGQYVSVNPNESLAIQAFVDIMNEPLGFDVYSYDVSTQKGRKIFEQEWEKYYCTLSDKNDMLSTPLYALIDEPSGDRKKVTGDNKTELGDEGEEYVFNLEKARVTKFNPRLANKVIPLGKTKGLGYDVQSVIAEEGDEAEFVKYIEVKSTKRVTAPDFSADGFVDTLNITRNEWIAAQQHKEYYSIYRVYFTREGVSVFVIVNPYQKNKDGQIQVTPITYRVDFDSSAVNGYPVELFKEEV